MKAGRIGTVGMFVVVAIVGGLLLSTLAPLRDLLDTVFNRKTFVATGDVVLKHLKETKELETASTTFEVPVVVCEAAARSYDLKAGKDKHGKTPARQLLDYCNGIGDEKATVLVEAEVKAIVHLDQLKDDSVLIEGNHVTLRLPAPVPSEPYVDAEKGVSVLSKDTSLVPFLSGLPDDYTNRAAGEAKKAVAKVATRSGLVEVGRKSAQSLFEGLLGSLGFEKVTVIFEPTPAR